MYVYAFLIENELLRTEPNKARIKRNKAQIKRDKAQIKRNKAQKVPKITKQAPTRSN